MSTSPRSNRILHVPAAERGVEVARQFGRKLLRSGLDLLKGLLEHTPRPSGSGPIGPPPSWTDRPLEPSGPTPYHDARAEPVVVQVSQGVIDRILYDALDHVRSRCGENETGWVPIGCVRGGVVRVEGLLPKGRGARATPGDFEIDHGHVLAALALAQARGTHEVVGLVHTHPGRMDFNSTMDRAADEAHVLTLPGGVGVYPIVIRDSGDCRGHVLSTGLRLSWWAMLASRPGMYVPCAVEVVSGDDTSSWVREFDDALFETSEVVLELLDRRIDVALLPSPGGAVDLVATRGSTSVLVHFEPTPGMAVVRTTCDHERARWGRLSGRELACRIAGALTIGPAEAMASPAVGRRAAPRAVAPVRNEPARRSGGQKAKGRSDRTGRSSERKTKKQPRTKEPRP